jgi:hypothetical protein
MTLSTSHSFLHVGTQCARQSSIREPGLSCQNGAQAPSLEVTSQETAGHPIAIVINIGEFRAMFFAKTDE